MVSMMSVSPRGKDDADDAVKRGVAAIRVHQTRLKACRECPGMVAPVVTGEPVVSEVMLVGQAPGVKEGPAGRPFAWTAGKTLFKWFAEIGLGEEDFRRRVYMAAVCRCFPGKDPRGGDRVPSTGEIRRCRQWLDAEMGLLKPRLLIPVGKLAIAQFIDVKRLDAVVGRSHSLSLRNRAIDVIPLPHPSGVSTWHRTEPGRTLLEKALQLVTGHPAWRGLL
jgi:uracil-DNA glycosylase